MTLIELAVILGFWVIALASPGPATLAIAGTAMASGRRTALSLAAGVATGSATWGLAAALGLGTVMIANAWVLEILRYVGAAYLFWLALKSLRSALQPRTGTAQPLRIRSAKSAYTKGLMIHLTNPKAILFWGALFAVVISPTAPVRDIIVVGLSCVAVSTFVFISYALIFSTERAMSVYVKLGRWFDGVFATLFGAASLKILTTKLA
ncbi:amino acid transporter [Rhodobacterales bacterium 52_120_T64]|nr:amino acid transporter [Rhodobacterales bacterium 52_120_T64]